MFAGWQAGTLFALDAATGTEVWARIELGDQWDNYFYGNGALVEDLDGDEILTQSGEGVLYVFDSAGTQVAAPSLGAESWIAPGFIDLDFDLRPEIVAVP